MLNSFYSLKNPCKPGEAESSVEGFAVSAVSVKWAANCPAVPLFLSDFKPKLYCTQEKQ